MSHVRHALALVALLLWFAPSTPAESPVVLELFTSQGCSSCPPADRLLSELAEHPELGERVLPLAFHVDYWNHVGWTDPFSDRRWSERQRRYVEVLDGDVAYTPQLVVNGGRHLVGSRRDEVLTAVREALDGPGAPVSVELTAEPVAGGVEVRARVAVERAVPGVRRLEVWAALWQDGLVTPVGRGENADRTLRNDRVVRRFERLFTVSARGGEEGHGETVLARQADWPLEELGVLVLVQDPKSRTIHGAAGVDGW